jgi:hypothetical protein
VSLMVVDEAARVPDDLYEAVKPMLATTDGALWLMSTPYGRQGFFYREWMHGGDDWLRVEAPATECSRIPARFLEEEREKKGERLFGQEYLCQFLQSEDCLFRQEDLDACFRDDLEAIFLRYFSQRRKGCKGVGDEDYWVAEPVGDWGGFGTAAPPAVAFSRLIEQPNARCGIFRERLRLSRDHTNRITTGIHSISSPGWML